MKTLTKKIKNILLIVIVFIIIILIAIILEIYNKKISNLNNEDTHLKNQSEEGLDIEYNLIQVVNDNDIRILITVKSTNGIDKIIYPNEESTINGNRKDVIALDYTVINGVDYKFKVIDINGNELENN